MRRWAIISLLFLNYSVKSQTVINLDTLNLPTQTENIYNKALFGDSLVSSFCIVIKNEVKLHKHEHHSEHVFVIDGEGQMSLENKLFTIKKGDLIFIPKNSIHSVKTTSKQPLKVMSIQAPIFDGKDRIIIK
ncbi:MAG: cupin domain-containing protein [Bacteroidota bacterium]|nr:cupin domain-containing protein [Bacteroidota bacterium]MDP3144466.1 cupin domain-containing protein [Bacteroidota bacterium]MDP3555856.1 cupin domain-containing protein [Bacteroidota bacterium]